jgi:hypothetical protein
VGGVDAEGIVRSNICIYVERLNFKDAGDCMVTARHF